MGTSLCLYHACLYIFPYSGTFGSIQYSTQLSRNLLTACPLPLLEEFLWLHCFVLEDGLSPPATGLFVPFSETSRAEKNDLEEIYSLVVFTVTLRNFFYSMHFPFKLSFSKQLHLHYFWYNRVSLHF